MEGSILSVTKNIYKKTKTNIILNGEEWDAFFLSSETGKYVSFSTSV